MLARFMAVPLARSVLVSSTWLLAVSLAGAALAACSSSGPSKTPPSRSLVADASGLVASLSGVRVVHPRGGASGPYLGDSRGETVLLRGVNDNALVAYPSDYQEAPPISSGDFAEMEALGFDFVRLPVSWSEIMPQPGVIDHAYLERVAHVVSLAKAHGIGVLVDMHQDNYSVYTGLPRTESDGAPRFAVLDRGVPCTPDLTTTKCALAAFASFWANDQVAGKPIQGWYLEALLAVAKAAGATSPSSDVVGVELMNEPWPAGPSPFEQRSLYPFYERMIKGLRAGGVVAPIWFEPSIVRDLTNDALPEAARFSSDQNLVYAVHIYTGVFSPPFSSKVPESDLAASYANAAAEAKVFGTPFVVDEYGSDPTPAWNHWLTEQISLQNQYAVGSAFWVWKQRKGYWYNWSVVNLDGSLRTGTLRAQLLGAPHVDVVPGRLVATAAGPERLSATVDGPGGRAILWGGVVVSQGAPEVTTSTLSKVTIDGRPARSRCRMVSFSPSSARASRGASVTSPPRALLSGCLLYVDVPPGRHVLVAEP
jgi:hypothetical protein